jgi:heptosyltransferase-2
MKDGLGLNKQYVVIHPGSGNPAKEWPIGNWSIVISALAQYELDIVITGHGEREAIQAEFLADNQTINLVGRLNFDQFTSVIAGAKAVFCVDSVAGHIAGAYDKKAIIIGNGLSEIERWHPLGGAITLLENKVSCSPCHGNPCVQRMCVTGIDPKCLIDQLPNILRR